MNKNVDLIGYLPLFVAEYKEIQQIMNTENPEFYLLENEAERVRNNQYIISCDENGIKRFEKLLNIVPLPDDTLDSRKSRCLMRWNETIPYTYKSLVNRLDLICGEGNYQLVLKPNDYEIEIVVSLELYGQTDELNKILSYILPANIAANVRNNIRCEAGLALSVGGAANVAEIITVST